jgi:hypothetical protein
LYDAKIKMVGVWDTIGALGIPALVGQVDPLADGFLDTSLHPDMLNAFHALSIDERRREFLPTLWAPPAAQVPGQVLEQVWFAGVHCDVGGGYPETGLSDITLSWMMGKAENLGLQIDPKISGQYASLGAANALDQIHQSWNLGWGFPKPRTVPTNSKLSNSVAIRCGSDNSYQPKNLDPTNGVLPASFQVVPVIAPPPA